MPLGSGARTILRYILEGTNGANFGVVPGSGNPKNLRRTDDGLGYKIQTQVSDEITPSGATADTILVSASADGPVNIEMSYREYDDLIEAALKGTWSVYGTAGQSSALSLTLNTAAGTITGTPTGADQFTGLAVGQWFRLVAPSDAANGAYLKVGSRTATVITVDAATPIPGTGTRTGVANCIVQSSRLTNGQTMRSFTLERAHTDLTKFIAFRGFNVNKWSFNLQSGSKVTGSFEFMGKDQMTISGTTVLPGTPVASETGDIMNAVTGVGNVLENNAPVAGTYIKSMTFSVDNKLRGRDGIGYLGYVDVAAGTLEVTGTMSVYFANETIYNKFINSQRTSFQFRMSDANGYGYVITMPSTKFTAGEVKAGGKEADSMVELSYMALIDPAGGQVVYVDRCGGPVTRV